MERVCLAPKYLKNDHSEEILRIYDEKLRWEAEQGTSRDRYESMETISEF